MTLRKDLITIIMTVSFTCVHNLTSCDLKATKIYSTSSPEAFITCVQNDILKTLSTSKKMSLDGLAFTKVTDCGQT